MYRDTAIRSWGALSWQSSTAIASSCSMILFGPMFQRPVRYSWKLRTSKFFCDLVCKLSRHTSPFKHVLYALDRRVWRHVQFSLTYPATIQSLKGSGLTFYKTENKAAHLRVSFVTSQRHTWAVWLMGYLSRGELFTYMDFNKFCSKFERNKPFVCKEKALA